MSNVLSKIETRLDKAISDLEKMNDNKLAKVIDDLEGIKTIIITDDIIKMSGQINWNIQKDNVLVREKSKTVRTGGRGSYDRHEWDSVGNKDTELYYRKLTPTECERLQTVPDGYTEGVSNTQRYRMLGNGWTVEVIKHILGEIR